MILVGDAPLLSMVMTIPERGPWRASVVCTFEPQDDIAILDDTDQAYVGTVRNGGVIGGRWEALIVGGAGALRSTVVSKNYQSTDVRTVARDICTDSGESYSAASDPSVVGQSLDKWSRGYGDARDALSELCDSVGAHWTVKPDGSIAIREMGYEDQEPEDALILNEDFTQETLTLAIDGLWLRPGMSQHGRRVRRVVYYIERDIRAVTYV